MCDTLRRVSFAVREMTIVTDDAAMQELVKAIADAKTGYQRAGASLRGLIVTDEGRAIHARITAASEAVLPLIVKAQAFAQANGLARSASDVAPARPRKSREAAAAAQSLKEQSGRLAETVSVFNLGGVQRQAGAVLSAAPRAASSQRALAVA